MGDKIKKVNSLDELNRLEIGDFIKIKTFANDKGLIFEEKIENEYRFMQIFNAYPVINCPVIWSERINEQNINFENGMVAVRSYKDIETEMYSEKDSCYSEKLNICKKAGII